MQHDTTPTSPEAHLGGTNLAAVSGSESLSWHDSIVTVSNRSEILEWIATIPYTGHHKRISEGRLVGTGDWLFAKKEYRDWQASCESKMLLLQGIRKLPNSCQVRSDMNS